MSERAMRKAVGMAFFDLLAVLAFSCRSLPALLSFAARI